MDMTPLEATVHESNTCWGLHDRSASNFAAIKSLLVVLAAAPGVDLKAKGSIFNKSALEMVCDKIAYMEEMIEGLSGMDFGCEGTEELSFQLEEDLMCVDLELRSAKALKMAMQLKGF